MVGTVTSGVDLVAAARAYLGTPYEYGGTLARGSLDCSELVLVAMRDLGLSVPDGSAAQIEACALIPLDVAQRTPGALLWREGHDGLSTGAPGVIEARAPVVVEGAWTETYDGGLTRWTRAGLLPGLTYPEEAVMAAPVPALLYPLRDGRVTSAFSRARRNPVTEKVEPHLGADIGNGRGYGEPVYALVTGVVVKTVTGRKRGQSSTVGDVLAPGRSGNGVLIGAVGGGVGMEQHVRPMVREGQAVVQGQQVGVTDDSGIQDGPHVHTEWWPTGKPSSAIDPAPYLVREVASTGVSAWPTASTTANTTKPTAKAVTTSEEDDYMRLNLIRRTSDGALALTGPGVFINLSADANGYATAKRLWSYAIGNAKDAKGEYIPDDVLPVEWDRVGALSRRNEG